MQVYYQLLPKYRCNNFAFVSTFKPVQACYSSDRYSKKVNEVPPPEISGEPRFHGKKGPKFPCDIRNAVRFVFKYSILRELRFSTLSAYPAFGNQKERFLELPRHLISPVVRNKVQYRTNSQSKTDQLFR